jgi:hypothetical protein
MSLAQAHLNLRCDLTAELRGLDDFERVSGHLMVRMHGFCS